jgi:mono/diheme cytochrome c family protein
MSCESQIIAKMKRSFRSLYLVLCVLGLGLVNSVAGEAPTAGSPMPAVIGRTLFLKNCAHCHANDATGDEGPDLHQLHRADDWIARRIRNGVKGEMTAFGEKFSDGDIKALIAYLRALK